MVGTYAGGAGRLYCPWWVARQLCLRCTAPSRWTACPPPWRTTGSIGEFWDGYASRYFVAPTKDGTPVPWGSLIPHLSLRPGHL